VVDVFVARPFNSRSTLNIGRRAGKPGKESLTRVKAEKTFNRASPASPSSSSSSSYLAPTRWTDIIQIPVHHHRVRRPRRVDVATARSTDTGGGGATRAVDGSVRVTARRFPIAAAAAASRRCRRARRKDARRAHRADAVKRSTRRDAW